MVCQDPVEQTEQNLEEDEPHLQDSEMKDESEEQADVIQEQEQNEEVAPPDVKEIAEEQSNDLIEDEKVLQ